MRAVARRWLESAIIASGGATLASRLRLARTIVLAYHDVAPDHVPTFGDASLHLPLGRFVEHLETLRRSADVVPLDALLRSARTRTARPRVAITFDDAYAGAVIDGVREVVARGMPATIFVAPGLLGARACWWDELADPATGEVAPQLRDRLLAEYAGLEEPIRAWAANAGAPLARPTAYTRIATLAELEAAARLPGITVASHSWSHARLDRLPDDALADELRRSLVWLCERIPGTRPWLAYPYGIGSPAVVAAARAVGYQATFRISGEAGASGGATGFEFARMNVPAGMSASGLALRTAGVPGLA